MVIDTEGIGKTTDGMDLVLELGHLVKSISVSMKTAKGQAKDSICGKMVTATSASGNTTKQLKRVYFTNNDGAILHGRFQEK